MEFKYNKSQVSIEIKTFTDNLFYENIKVGKIRQNKHFVVLLVGSPAHLTNFLFSREFSNPQNNNKCTKQIASTVLFGFLRYKTCFSNSDLCFKRES